MFSKLIRAVAVNPISQQIVFSEKIVGVSLSKIGIILEQDQQRQVQFQTPEVGLMIWKSQDMVMPLKKGAVYDVIAEAGTIQLWHQSECLHTNTVPAYLMHHEDILVEPSACVRIQNILVGRNFHWQKYISQILPGNFLITNANGFLVWVNELPLEIYLLCVASSEMSPDCPIELVKAQLIAARSWFLAHAENKHPGWDACNDDCCQRYQGLGHITQALWNNVKDIQGLILAYQGKIVDARYSKCCGGRTEASWHIWPQTKEAYLISVWDSDQPLNEQSLQDEQNMQTWVHQAPRCFCNPDMDDAQELIKYLGQVDVPGHYFRWQQSYSAEEFTNLLVKKLPGIAIERVLGITCGERGESGRLKQLRIAYQSPNGLQYIDIAGEYQIRSTLHPSFLYSSAFVVQEQKDAHGILQRITLVGSGWGHGVGMCQMGALGMALQGFSHQAILHHYFPGTDLILLDKLVNRRDK